MQQQKLQTISYFTDPLLLSYVTSYLTLRQKLTLSCLNKQIRFIMQDYFKMVLSENKLFSIPNKSSIHQMRFYFDRCLNIFRYSKQSDKEEVAKKRKDNAQIIANQYQKITIQNPFKFNVILYFEVGLVYTAFLDHQNRAFIFRTNHLLSLIQNQSKPLYEIDLGVKQIKCKGEKLLILKVNGEVYTWQTDKKGIEIKIKTTHLFWTMHIPVKNIYSSFNYAIFLLENPHQSREVLYNNLFHYDLDTNIDSLGKYYTIALNHQTGALYIIDIDAETVMNTAVGHKQAYFVNQRHQCLIVEFDQLKEGTKELKAKVFAPLAKKRIVKVYGIYNFFIALQRNIEVIQEWTNDEVINWMRQIGFGDFIKIARAQKIDGKRLQNITRSYMQNVLGMSKLNMQQKFMLCINEVIQGKNQCDQIWVWGKNDYGQLGVTHANYIMAPHRLKMDFLKDKDRIDTVFCGWYQTYIRTHRGKIYQSTINSQRKKKKVVQQKQSYLSDQQQELKKEMEQTFRYKNKKRKKTQDLVVELTNKRKQHHKRFEQEVRWTESPAGKAFFVQSFKEFVFYIQCPGQNKFQPTKQKKLRTSKAIIDRILWDQNLNKSQFKIGLIDKDMGTIEVTLYQIQAFDYKETSIRYVKRNNTVVWDRENKIDYL